MDKKNERLETMQYVTVLRPPVFADQAKNRLQRRVFSINGAPV